MRMIYQVLEQYLNEKEYKWERKGDRLRIPLRGDNGSWTTLIDWNEDDRWICVRSVMGFAVPPAKRRAVAEFVARANYGLIIGNFELDFNDGEAAYRTSAILREDELSEVMLADLFYANLHYVDRYMPGLMAVAFGGRPARKAIDLVEGTGQPTPQDAPADDTCPRGETPTDAI